MTSALLINNSPERREIGAWAYLYSDLRPLHNKEKAMKCVICKTGITHQGVTTSMFDRQECIVVVKDIPAHVCDQCGEAYFSADMLKKLYDRLQFALEHGTELEVI